MGVMSGEHFRKTIVPGRDKGSIVIKTEGGEDRVMSNQAKDIFIAPDLLGNLSGLAIEAMMEGNDDSMGQMHLKKAHDKLKRKFPSEQPHEVYRRTLATLAGDGADIESIAGAMLAKNGEFRTEMNLGDLTNSRKSELLKTLMDQISIYWPSSPNMAA